MRSRDLGIVTGTGTVGAFNAITDVPGVRVGQRTLIEGSHIRTGVTVIEPVPGDATTAGLFAGFHTLNGNGEVTGVHWVRESGLLTSPIGLTNTNSVGVVRDELNRHLQECNAFWSLSVVGETWDGVLNDIGGFHVKAEHIRDALAALDSGPVAEGGVGGGTGMICHGFKAGIGTASRLIEGTPWTLGVLVQTNHGRRARLSVNGAPVGRLISPEQVPVPTPVENPSLPEGSGSIIVVVATDAPMLPHQLNRLAQRASLGIARTGGAGENSSGDFVITFSTATVINPEDASVKSAEFISDAAIDPHFYAAIEATEEAILNSMVAATTMTGRGGVTAYALDHDVLLHILDRYQLRVLPTS